MNAKLPTHYRVVDVLYEDGVTVRLEQWEAVRETAEGYWVKSQYAPEWLDFDGLKRGKYLKWVSKSSVKRHCCPTIDEAMRSFKRRKEMQVRRLRLQLEQAELVVSKFECIDLSGDQREQLLGHTESSSRLVWDY